MRSARLSIVALCLCLACGSSIDSTPVIAPAPGSHIRYSTGPDSSRLAKARLVTLDAERLVVERFAMDPMGRTGDWIQDSVPTRSLATLQVRVRRRSHAAQGALVGMALGAVAGVACLAQKDDWLTPTDGQCMVGGVLGGAGYGALIGLLIKSDVYAPTVLPSPPPEQEPPVTLLR
jgi:hypothetical protein